MTSVRIITHHQHIGDIPDYHEWTFVGMAKMNKRGYPNPRMYDADWQCWRCNNTDCPGRAVISNDLIRSAIDTFGAAS